MGCGQSKINLYPRRNKSGSKANGAKKSGTAESKETDEEEGSRADNYKRTLANEEDDSYDETDRPKDILPLVSHTTHMEPSPSQLEFFKMLDERIEQGRDYDSSSETELEIEHMKKEQLIQEWKNAAKSNKISVPSPPTPVRKRPSPQGDSRSYEQASPSSRRCLKTQTSVVGELPTPPARRCTSADQYQNGPKRQINGSREWPSDIANSPMKKPYHPAWKTSSKGYAYNQAQPEKYFVEPEEEMMVTITSERTVNNSHEKIYSSRETSQITYNPTFQTHSPAHQQRSATNSPQPYIAQIVTYPKSQPITAIPEPYISPPETYQDPKPTPNYENAYQNQPSTSQSSATDTETKKEVDQVDKNTYINVKQPSLQTQVKAQSAQNISSSIANSNSGSNPNIYYIHGNPQQDKIMAQRQQTAIHLQQYVAMKQAQQNVYGYLQRLPHTIYPNPEYLPVQQPPEQSTEHKIYETVEESYGSAFYPGLKRPQTAPSMTNQNQVRPARVPNVNNPLYQMTPLLNQIPYIGSVSQGMPIYGQYSPSQQPQTEVHYYHQMVQNPYRPGSAGTLTRYQKVPPNSAEIVKDKNKPNVFQSYNIIRQKSVGQIVPVGSHLGVYKTDSNINPDAKPAVRAHQTMPRQKSFDLEAMQSSQMNNEISQKDSKTSNTLDKKCKKKSLRTIRKSKSGEFSQ